MSTVSPKGATREQRGMTLLEVLVALVVMASGLLGVAALQVAGLRTERASVHRAAAIGLATDMAERIRANPRAGDAYAGSGPGAAHGCAGGSPCRAEEMADDDWFRWLGDIGQHLPGAAAGRIEAREDGTLMQYEITVRWSEPGEDQPVSYTVAVLQRQP